MGHLFAVVLVKTRLYNDFSIQGSVAEWSKALVLGTSHFDGVGSNPTAATFFFFQIFVVELSSFSTFFFSSFSKG